MMQSNLKRSNWVIDLVINNQLCVILQPPWTIDNTAGINGMENIWESMNHNTSATTEA